MVGFCGLFSRFCSHKIRIDNLNCRLCAVLFDDDDDDHDDGGDDDSDDGDGGDGDGGGGGCGGGCSGGGDADDGRDGVWDFFFALEGFDSWAFFFVDDMMFPEFDRNSVSYCHTFPFKRLQLIIIWGTTPRGHI